MSSPPKFDEFLITATGLPWEQIARLYNAGHPWPLWAAHDIRKAGLLAQAKGLFFPEALSEIQRETDAQANSVLAQLEADNRPSESVTVDQRIQALTSFPWMKAVVEHIDQVAARTTTSRRVVWRVSLAIQRYAILNPGWELVTSWPDTLPGGLTVH